jgi:hypothetical protein
VTLKDILKITHHNDKNANSTNSQPTLYNISNKKISENSRSQNEGPLNEENSKVNIFLL